MRQPILPVPVAMLVMVFLAVHLPGLALGCGDDINAAAPGEVSSDGAGDTCIWRLFAAIDHRIVLHITTMDFCVEIFDGDSDDDFLIHGYCQAVPLPAILSSSNSLYIRTYSNGYEGAFRASYSQIDEQTLGCDQVLTASSGHIRSPDADEDDNYEINANCFWLIKPDSNNQIILTIESMDIENANNCDYDYIKIYKGDSEEAPLIGTYCGPDIPPPINSSSNALFVRFSSDYEIVKSGFTASYGDLGPVDGGWSLWGQWGDCSKTCGQGTRTRNRQCDSPPPASGGADCTGDIEESETCFLLQCPVNGGWSVWGQWGDCSKTCGQGTRTRNRQCDSPPPASGGADCTGDIEESETCFLLQCPVHGDWGTWDQWGDCSKTCGQGTRTRNRQCDSPAPLHGGDDCTGDHAEYNPCYCQECHEESVPAKDCAVAFSQGEDLCGDNSRCKNTKYGHKCKCCKDYKWNKATGQCVAAPGANENRPCCGDCQHDKCNITGKVCSKDRKEYDSVAELVLDRCQKGYGPGKELAIRNFGACEGPVTPWSEWGPCSLTCGKGLKMKTRNATKELSKKNQKKFPLTKTAYCYNAPCPGYCSLVTKHGFYTMERNGLTYTTTVAVSYTACEGDCENECSESGTEEKKLSFSCASGQTITQLAVQFPTSCCCS